MVTILPSELTRVSEVYYIRVYQGEEALMVQNSVAMNLKGNLPNQATLGC